jgi:hypothetical protein
MFTHLQANYMGRRITWRDSASQKFGLKHGTIEYESFNPTKVGERKLNVLNPTCGYNQKKC